MLVREGRTWIFGDNINTDLILPTKAFGLPESLQFKQVFTANRPGWVEQVVDGDVIIGGRNFGIGSGRPVGRLLGECGIAGLVAESVNGLCLRNCVNYAFPVLECVGVTRLFDEGQRARINFQSGLVVNLDTGEQLAGRPMPTLFNDTIESGGVIEMLVREGFIEPTAFKPQD